MHKKSVAGKLIKTTLLIFTLILLNSINAQKIEIRIKNMTDNKAYISSIAGEILTPVDTVFSNDGQTFKITPDLHKYHNGIYRLVFDKNKWIDFVNDGEDVELITDAGNPYDSLKVISSPSNKFYYLFLKLNKNYKVKTELLQFILARYPKDDDYYKQTKNRLTELQNEYTEFVNVTSQSDQNSFVAMYIRCAQLPVVDLSIPPEKQLLYLKAHALDYVDFSNSRLINSDLYSNKSIEYLTYFRNPQLPMELLEKEFMNAVDSLLNKARVNQLVYQHITGYLIDGFKKFGFDKVLDYIVENYVIKDDLCLDVKTEGLIKRRIDQSRRYKIGTIVPNITLPDPSGKIVSLDKIKAKKIVIIFYASWCPHCKELLPKLNELYLTQNRDSLAILAVSLDQKREEWLEFMRKSSPSLINTSDGLGWDGKAASDYFIYATPTMFLVDSKLTLIGKPMTITELTLLLSK